MSEQPEERNAVVKKSSSHDSAKSEVKSRLARRLLFKTLNKLSFGTIVIEENGRSYTFNGLHDGPQAHVQILEQNAYTNIAFGGSVGAAEAYISDKWTTHNLTDLVRVFVLNRNVLEGLDGFFAALSRCFRKLLHWTKRNSLDGSRRNIAAHYDLGNEFFAGWLDKSLMYSSAIFQSEEMTLEEASLCKLERICKKLDLQPQHHILEIGTGWGGFAVYAAKHYHCHVTTTTISRKQYEFVKERIAEQGLQDKVTVLFKDYRQLEGKFDRVCSIEMIEAVGSQFLDTYFSKCSSLLKEDGLMLLQAITIEDQRYEKAVGSVDFIKQYIFPGGFLPSVTAIINSTTKCTDLRLFHHEDIGSHYATTLRHWNEAFHQNLDVITTQGFDREFQRMWRYYLSYCEGGFIERTISCVQMLLVKPDNRRVPIAPMF